MQSFIKTSDVMFKGKPILVFIQVENLLYIYHDFGRVASADLLICSSYYFADTYIINLFKARI